MPGTLLCRALNKEDTEITFQRGRQTINKRKQVKKTSTDCNKCHKEINWMRQSGRETAAENISV